MFTKIKKHIARNIEYYVLVSLIVGGIYVGLAIISTENKIAPCIIKNQHLSQPREVCIAMFREGMIK